MVICQFSKKDKYKSIVFTYADLNGLDRSLVLAIIKVESNYDEKAVSNKNACGLMQLMPKTFDFIARYTNEVENLDIFNARDNVKIGCAYVRYLFNKFDCVETVLCAYNAGEGNVRKWLNDPNYSNDQKKLFFIPYEETACYVKKVQFYAQNYKRYDL